VIGTMRRSRLELEHHLAQRRAAVPPLAHFVKLPERNSAMAQAYATGCYSLKEIGQAFSLHYATVSRLVRTAEIESAR
jgi:hypothetical protein